MMKTCKSTPIIYALILSVSVAMMSLVALPKSSTASARVHAYVDPDTEPTQPPTEPVFTIKDENGTAVYRYFSNTEIILSKYIENEDAPQGYTVEVAKEVNGLPVKFIGAGSMAGLKQVSEVVLPDSIEVICTSAFDNDTKLRSITLPNKLRYIENNAFSRCASLAEITLPGDPTQAYSSLTIEPYAFRDSGLKTVHFVDGVTHVPLNGFSYFMNVEDIYYDGTLDQWNAQAKILTHGEFQNTTIHCKTYANLNGDNQINASDAALILIASAEKGAVKDVNLTEQQKLDADVNKDGSFDASDAAVVLMYSAAYGSGQNVTLQDFIK